MMCNTCLRVSTRQAPREYKSGRNFQIFPVNLLLLSSLLLSLLQWWSRHSKKFVNRLLLGWAERFTESLHSAQADSRRQSLDLRRTLESNELIPAGSWRGAKK
jgi:hypothetical protein